MKTKEITFSLPGRDLKLMVVADVESLITDPTDEDEVPCWAEIWPAARGLALWLWNNVEFNGEQLLELGAGLGLPGIVCGLKGAEVVLSDFKREALSLARENARLNGLSNIRCHLGDWRSFDLDRKFDYIIGSDIFYDPKLNVHLLRIVNLNLKERGHLIIAHPGRPATYDFINNLRELKDWKQVDAAVEVTVDDPYFPHYRIDIHHLY